MLPILNTKIKNEEKQINAFGGINLTAGAKIGELDFSENMTGDNYPSLSSCHGKSVVFETDRIINAIAEFEGWICTSYSADKSEIWLTFDGNDYEFTTYSSSDDFTQNRKIASLSDSILIIPDNVIFHTNSRTFSKICVSEKHTEQTAKNKFKTEAPESNIFDTASINKVAYLKHNKIYFHKTSYYSNGNYDFYTSSFDDALKSGDVITIKGKVYSPYSNDYPAFDTYAKKILNGITLKIKSIVTETHKTPTGEITENIELVFDDNTIDTGGYNSVCFSSLTLERGMPKLENICSFANRIWATSGKEIFASKLSDASEWNDFSVDDYGTMPYSSFNTLTETEGVFTAIIPFENYIYAFKENAIHKIYGNEPDEYTIHSYRLSGVKNGSSDTIDACNDSLIFAGTDAIYLYNNDHVKNISEPLGSLPSVLSAKATSNKYYALCEESGKKYIYVYDKKHNMWHKQTAEKDSLFICEYANKIYEAGGGKIYLIENESCETPSAWSFKLKIDDKLFGRKTHGQIFARYTLEENSSFTVRPIYDDGSSGEICAFYHDKIQGGECKMFLKHKRCSWMILEFKGKGSFTLKSMKIRFYRGSEL